MSNLELRAGVMEPLQSHLINMCRPYNQNPRRTLTSTHVPQTAAIVNSKALMPKEKALNPALPETSSARVRVAKWETPEVGNIGALASRLVWGIIRR